MATKKTSATVKKPKTPRLRVRMYRQGLGDCFLLTFNNQVHVLIDCGVILGTKEPAPLMTRVVDNIREVTGGKVDVLVVTHEHWDHVSGFTQAKDSFDKITFKEVWMAWTEDDTNAFANQLREARANKQKAVAAAATRLTKSKSAGLKALGSAIDRVLGFAGVSVTSADGGSTADAMAYARGRSKTLKFMKPGQRVFNLPGASDVRVYVLGPPENALIKRSDPSTAHSEVYLTLADTLLAAAAGSDAEAAFPFAPAYRVMARKGKPSVDASDELKTLFSSCYLDGGEAYRTIEDDWLASAGGLALQLDGDTNNTSLVLAFEFADTGDVFLFPGDAQVGNWLSWDDCQWTIKGTTVTAADLLARTLLYKVGHHGSHNATLKEKGLERMTRKDLVAMIPVNQEMAAKKTWEMPWPNLRASLEAKCSSLIVEDEAETAAKPKRGRVVLAPAKGNEASLYVDYLV